MKVLSLFSGGGLGDYGLELAGMEIVGQVEIDDYCQKVLALRWPEVPKWTDVRAVHAKEACPLSDSESIGRNARRTERQGQFRTATPIKSQSFVGCPDCIDIGTIDVISGGFPCQDISTAGRGVGITGARSGLWKEMFRIIREVRPRYVLVENVTALLGRGFGTVLGDLAEIGYDTEWDCIPASALGAPHQRDRVWVIAYSESVGAGEDERGLRSVSNGHREGIQADKVADTDKLDAQGSLGGFDDTEKRKVAAERPLGFRGICNTTSERFSHGSVFPVGGPESFPESERPNWWAVEPNVGRVANGITNRVDRLKLLGNGQVVQVVEWIGTQIMKYDKALNDPHH